MDVSQPYLKERWYCIKRPTGVTDGADKSLPADKPSGDDDVYLVAQDGTVFKANQKVLKVNSMYFRKILNQLKKNEVTVVLKETSARTLGLVLEYIEKGTVMLELSQVEAFVDSATSLQLKGIVSDFEDIVEEKEKHDESQESVLEEDQLSVLSTPRRHRGGRRRILSSTLSVSSHDSDVQFIKVQPSSQNSNRYKNYKESEIRKAIEEVLKGELTTYAAAKKYGIPSRTLYSRVNRAKKAIN